MRRLFDFSTAFASNQERRSKITAQQDCAPRCEPRQFDLGTAPVAKFDERQ